MTKYGLQRKRCNEEVCTRIYANKNFDSVKGIGVVERGFYITVARILSQHINLLVM